MLRIFLKAKVLTLVGACVLIVLYFTISTLHTKLEPKATKVETRNDVVKATEDSAKAKEATLQEVEKLLFSGHEISDSDSKLAELIRYKYIDKPTLGAAYKLEQPNKKDYSRGQSAFINEILQDKKGGFFIDIGAGDGESESISLLLEKELDWTGLLIEPNPKTRQKLQTKNRKSSILRGCVNPARVAAWKMFSGSQMSAGEVPKQLIQENQKLGEQGIYSTMCFSFYTIVTALGRRQIDLLTIDVHGKELDILESIPFDLIEVDIISVEHGLGVADDIIRSMETRGYHPINVMENRVTDKRDLLFQRNRSLKH